MEELFACPLCRKSFLNGKQLEAHVLECRKGVELDKRKVIKKEIKLEVDEDKVIKKEIKLESDKIYGVMSSGPNENPKEFGAIDKKSIKKEIKSEVDEKVIKKEIKLEVDEKVIKKEIKQEVISDFIFKQCGKDSHSSSGLASHIKTHWIKRKRSNRADEVKKGALSLMMLSQNRKDLYLDEDKLVIPNVYVNGVKKEGYGESGAGQSSTGILNTNLGSNVQEVMDKGDRKANDNNRSSTVLREPKTYKCEICFKEFSSGQALGGHIRIHKQTQ